MFVVLFMSASAFAVEVRQVGELQDPVPQFVGRIVDRACSVAGWQDDIEDRTWNRNVGYK